jgi:N-acetylneuraminate synthase
MRLLPAKIIAEIGCNHKGDMAIAKEMISTAAIFCRADVVKFQKRNNRELLTPEQYEAPHPNPANSYGGTYGAHREFLEFSVDQHRQLMEWCDQFNIEYSTSVWDVSSAREMAALRPRMLKVPSASNLHFEMLDVLCGEFGGEIHLSLGMTTHEEEEEIVSFFEGRKRAKDLVLYSCTSGYPVPFENVCLLEISRLRKRFETRVKEIGFSGHHLGVAVDVAAFVLGATWIERHFTLDRTWKGTDHAASLEPDGMRRVKRDIVAVSKAMSLKERQILPIEEVQRTKLKWRNRSST